MWAEQSSRQSEQGLHHQRDMTFNNTLFLSAIIHPLDEVVEELVRHVTDAELPYAAPVRAKDLANILDAVEDNMPVDVLAVDVSSVIEMIDCS